MISILLPTIRPDLINDTIKNIMESTYKDFEIIVVADYPKSMYYPEQVKWGVQERLGTVAAINYAHQHAKGDYYFLMNDESRLHLDALKELIYFSMGHTAIVTPEHHPYFPFYYYGRFFAAFPFVSKEVLTILCNNEYILDPQFKCFYSDPDLSLRAWEKNIPVLTCDKAILTHLNKMDAYGHQDNVSKYLTSDRYNFRNRWIHLGELIDP